MQEGIKYTDEDIDRIFAERVLFAPRNAEVKDGVVAEWSFTYPNGKVSADVEYAFCIDPEHNDYAVGIDICRSKIRRKLWEICGQYSLITGEKL